MIKNRWFYFGIFVLGIYFLIRLIDQSKILFMFPLDFANDYSAHMAKVYFLAKYGYGNIVPNWWGGFPLLKFYHPGSAFFALPLFYLFNNVQISQYLAILLIYLFSFVAIFYIGKIQRWSIIKRIAFFLFFFANPISISYLRVGRYGELFGFFWSIVLFLIIIWYKDHKIDKKFLFFIPVYCFLLLSHISVFMVYSSLVFSLFLIKDLREKIFVFFAGLAGLGLASFWWIPFMIGIKKTFVTNFYGLQKTLLLKAPYTLGDRVTSFIVPFVFFVVLCLYWKSSIKSKKDLIFYSVPFVLGILFFTRLAAYIPFMNRPIPDTYNLYFIFLSLFLLFNIRINRLPNLLKKCILLGLIIIPISGVLISYYLTPFFPVYGDLEGEVVSIVPLVDESFIMIGETGQIYANAVYSYAAIKYNLYTPAGWGAESVSNEYRNRLGKLKIDLDNGNCGDFLSGLKDFKITDVIAYMDCEKILQCGLKEKVKKEHFCLLGV